MIALYARQSVERENSVSIETQLDYCRAALKPDERRLPRREYVDEGCSGGNTNREGFRKMMRDIQRGKITKVVTYKLDRISRSLNDFVGILQTFKAHRVEFVSSQESFDTASIYGDLILKILIVFAEFERTSIINRVRDAYAKRTDLGLYMGGRRQYGFQLEEAVVAGIATKRYRPVPDELEQVRYLFDLYAKSGVSLRQTLDILAKEEPEPNREWTTARLSALLKNPVYVKADCAVYQYFLERGVRIVNPPQDFDGVRAAMLYGKTTHDAALNDWSDMKLVLAQHAGAVPSGVWLQCQRKLEKNRRIGRSASNPTSWLAGKLICAKCGHTMTTTKSRRRDGSVRRYFNCTGKSHKRVCTGVGCTVYAEDMEQLAEACIAERLRLFCGIPAPLPEETAARVNELRLEVSRVERQEQDLSDMLLSGAMNGALMEVANRKAAALQTQKRQLSMKIDSLRSRAGEGETPPDFTRRWKNAAYEEKKAVAGLLIHQIIVYEDGAPEIIWNA